MRRLILDSHAVDQMRDRRVNLEEMQATIDDPHEEYPTATGTTIMARNVAGRRIKLYVIPLGTDQEHNELYLVKTVAVRGE